MTELPSRVDVVVAGAGLAGLGAARVLAGAGLEVLLLDAGDAPGGRLRTDHVGGLLLDRGFQLLNPSYPQLRRGVDLDALELRPFEAGAVVATGARRIVVGDPRRMPRDLRSTLRLPFGTMREKLAFARWALYVGFGPVGRIKNRVDSSLAQRLRDRGMDGALTDRVLRPFLAGVLGEDDLRTSAVFAELVVRSFIRGTPALPAAGIQALPEQLAAGLPAGTLRLSTRVRAVHSGRVETERGSVTAGAVVVATDPRSAAALVGLPEPAMRGLTTFYHLAAEPPTARALLYLDADRRGPVVNTTVLTNAAPSYGPGCHLLASTVLGGDGGAEMEGAARQHAGTVYGVDSSSWELVATYAIPDALPDTPAGTPLRKDVALGDGLFIAGDHRDTASIQGAMVSGRRAAAAVLAHLG